jgi:hypothetical protein
LEGEYCVLLQQLQEYCQHKVGVVVVLDCSESLDREDQQFGVSILEDSKFQQQAFDPILSFFFEQERRKIS